jgi:hypothetical protein
VKGEFNKDREVSKIPYRKPGNKKSSLSQIKNTVVRHSRRLEQVEERISELEDKIDLTDKDR